MININNSLSGAYGLPGAQNDTYAAAKADDLKQSLNNINNASDEELMQVCEDFESYLVEQVFKAMEKTVGKDEEENEYMQYFGDNLYQEYAADIADKGDLGIAQTLYESMKRDYNIGGVPTVITDDGVGTSDKNTTDTKQ